MPYGTTIGGLVIVICLIFVICYLEFLIGGERLGFQDFSGGYLKSC